MALGNAVIELESQLIRFDSVQSRRCEVIQQFAVADGRENRENLLGNRAEAIKRNTIIGEGDAGKPSEKIKLVLTGAFDSIHLVVKNGKKLVLDKRNLVLAGDMEFVLNNTGCEDVAVTISRNTKNLLKDTIAMRCGE